MAEFLMDACLVLGVMVLLALISWIPALGSAIWLDDFDIAPFSAWITMWVLCGYACVELLGV